MFGHALQIPADDAHLDSVAAAVVALTVRTARLVGRTAGAARRAVRHTE